MKKLIISTLAVLALTTTAYATDLPSKNKAPVPTPAPVAAESTDSISLSYGQDDAQNFGNKIDDSYTIGYTHKLGAGFSVGGIANLTNNTANATTNYAEAQAGYALPAFAGVTLSGKVGVGERFTQGTDYAYYTVYGNADYKVMDKLTWNAVQYRWRSPFDTASYSWQSNQIGTGVTYDITNNLAVNAKVYRQWDGTFANVTQDGFGLGVTVKF